ncbi:Deblocking aminopeptidase [Indibacter alkaliphilus LW1]|uniref:Deblocking aminopeptidase n=1 Tax=Indibacter alkaliphilus (strain CCUG 57479 / KCTC 22604 / LW1) TaxID=1189612 RepID=S2DN77_INDAL|nr:M42 family metallopeptidase [Indibacter alkaliphilus]EPA00530.1 Deblocking aminopeptidase [Indibacter alkaliphilus LW1]
MEINVSLLKQICEIAGAPGYEKRVRDLVIELVTPFVDEVKTDNLGNVIAVKKSKNNPVGKKVMVAAHMDEIGFIVTHIDDKGFVRFHTLGGFDPKTLTAQRVIIHGKKDLVGVMGSKPIHVMSPEERTKLPKTTDFFIDLGMPKNEVEKYISVGDPITRDRELIEMGDCVNCKSIDNRVAVFILIETLKQLENPAFDVYATFTVQEEVGLRGANVAAHGINPDFGIALDTTIAYDVPGAQSHEKITELGNGTAVKIMDGMTICDYRMVDFMKQTADKYQIKWQPEILTAGGTDTAGIQRMGKQGSIAGAISIPTRHLHQVIEMAHKEDIAGSIQLLKACLEDMDDYNWDH